MWYKNAIVYSLDVETFMDSNGDGIGDFPGLTDRLDYLAGLGITCLWLLPFYPSPNRDNGYDVMDYYSIDSRLGTLGDFVDFMHKARENGIRVLVDLVVNHTSIEHPWFQQARSHRESPYRDYYVWTDQPSDHPSLVAFPTVEDSIWEYDEQAGAYYLHHFYKEQPDLNIANPAVKDEIRKIMGFWLALGVSGFRIDAAPFLIENVGIEGVKREELQLFLEEMREFLLSRQGDAILLAEANVSPDKIPVYFGDGDRMHILFNFLLNQYMFLAIARQNAEPLRDGLNLLPGISANGQWLNFVRHHDELTLDRLTASERQEVFEVFAPQETMRIFDRGIRRRLAPMMECESRDRQRRRIELVYSLMFSLPGTPMIRYGAETGMGDDLSLEERDSVRTPMQWANAPHGGFSTTMGSPVRPVISDGPYGYQQVNVVDQQSHFASLMNWMEHLIRIRKQCPELGSGTCHPLETDNLQVFAHSCTYRNRTLIAVHNLADADCVVTLKPDACFNPDSNRVELLCDRASQAMQDPASPSDADSISLAAYGYRWFRVDQNR